MFAVIKTGGKQVKVANNDTITVAKIDVEPGKSVTFGEVVMFSDGKTVQVGAPLISGLSVTGEIVEHTRGEKVIAFKKRRRQNSRRKRGHRQDYTIVRITAIGSHAADSAPAGAKKTKKKEAAVKTTQIEA